MLKALSLLAAGEVGGAIRRNVVILAIYAVASVIFLVACGFLIAAGHTLLAEELGSVFASLIIAGAFAAVALVLVVVAMIMRGRARRRSKAATAALVAAPMVIPAARALVANPTVGAGIVAGVVAIGALVGRQLGKHD